MARRSLPTRVQSVAATTTVLVLLAAAVLAVPVEIINHCSGAMKLYDGENVTRLKENGTVTFDLPPRVNRAYRYDMSPQATLAEFTIDAENKTWFDISIIPTGPLSGPKNCKSLSECKALTGGVGFNKPMTISPKVTYADPTCRKLVCLVDGCDDAYQYPQQDEKTHACAAGVAFQVVFCPSSSDVERDWVDALSALESGNTVVGADATPLPSSSMPKTPLPATAAPNTDAQTRAGVSDESSAAMYVASALGGTIAAAVVVAMVVQYRQRIVANVEYHWPDRKSSDAISFASARDVI